MSRVNIRSVVTYLAILCLLVASTGCSYTTESDGLKVVDIERGDSVKGLIADEEEDDIMLVTVETTNKDAKGKLNELVIANDTDLFKLFKGDELVAEASSISNVSGKVEDNNDESLIEIVFPVPKSIKRNLFLSVESFPKISLDNHISRSKS